MSTFTPQKPSITNAVAPTFNTITATDKFAAGGGSYILWYRNGATIGTGVLYVVDQNVTVPPGAATPTPPTGATNWSDAAVVSNMAATSDKVIAIDNINIQNYIDTTGFVNLKHNGTITTITLAILGPF